MNALKVSIEIATAISFWQALKLRLAGASYLQEMVKQQLNATGNNNAELHAEIASLQVELQGTAAVLEKYRGDWKLKCDQMHELERERKEQDLRVGHLQKTIEGLNAVINDRTKSAEHATLVKLQDAHLSARAVVDALESIRPAGGFKEGLKVPA